jgi:5S rRNA maturation endonuclease (ribonuclease M5)
VDFAAVEARLAASPETTLFRWFPAGVVISGEFCIGSLKGEAGKSLKFHLTKHVWKDWATGDSGVGFTSLYAAAHALRQGQALKEIAESLGLNGAEDRRPLRVNGAAGPVHIPAFELVPVPDYAPRDKSHFSHPEHGAPSELFFYTDRQGLLLYVKARYTLSGSDKKGKGRKAFCPFTWKAEAWRPEAPPAPRPLYGLDRLPVPKHGEAASTSRVIVVEGEKAANALRSIVTQPVITWSDGAASPHKTDWRALEGRNVLLWPDADEEGERAMDKVAAALRDLRCTLERVDVSGQPESWDAADAIASGWKPQNLREWLKTRVKSAKPPAPEIGEISPASPYSRSGAIVVQADSVAVRDIENLWPTFLYIGKPTLIVGDPGLGKSLVTIDIAARVSRGMDWPLKVHNDKAGYVLMCSAEDDPSDTMVPRLMAAGADLSRVGFWESVREVSDEGAVTTTALAFDKHMKYLEEYAQGKKGELRLVIVDPISAFLGATDSHKNSDVRALIAALAAQAAKYRFSVLVISHLNKSASTKAVYKIMGSLAFVAAARAAFAVMRAPDDPARRVLLPVKNNIAPDLTGLSFCLNAADNGAPYVAWGDTAVDSTTADALLEGMDKSMSDHAIDNRMVEVLDWLKGELASGLREAAVVWQASEEKGFSKRDMNRAKKQLGVAAQQKRFHGPWYWYLPSGKGT